VRGVIFNRGGGGEREGQSESVREKEGSGKIRKIGSRESDREGAE
jgi:hypothetical protein